MPARPDLDAMSERDGSCTCGHPGSRHYQRLGLDHGCRLCGCQHFIDRDALETLREALREIVVAHDERKNDWFSYDRTEAAFSKARAALEGAPDA